MPGSESPTSRAQYEIDDEDGKVHTAYKFVFSIPGTSIPFEYYGVMGTTWEDPPILDNPTETREIGGREYDLFYDGDRLRMVALAAPTGGVLAQEHSPADARGGRDARDRRLHG